ncbi:AAA family ATPase [Cobetia amphilecti]|uniref:AAA family ATPase n=1 Tax=Cobetia amphilecti TaxID=1055104 RepID=UPI0026E29F89|nr:AAA family ATPase [Cobetia amphilecti]MDO6814250.1 AAA family ATPase [Cobetia amphilecti]
MLKNFRCVNNGPISEVDASSLGALNLFIGKNGCGKTWLLKTMYSLLKSQEEYKRGQDNREFSEVLSNKLYWTFQTQHLGEMVRRGKGNRLEVDAIMVDNKRISFEFGPDTTKTVKTLSSNLGLREDNSIFLPPKEVLSLWNVIMKSALQNREFGYDATYLDLVLALQNPTQAGKNYNSFAMSRQKLKTIFKGRVYFENQQWVYKQGHSKFSIHNTAEGIKKLSILDTLLGNRYITPNSVIFIDEPESALHPTAIVEFLDILHMLSQQGIQVFMATHSYYVIKKLLLIAKHNDLNIPCFVADENGSWLQSCLLRDGLPDNEIINESVRLFEQEFQGV